MGILEAEPSPDGGATSWRLLSGTDDAGQPNPVLGLAYARGELYWLDSTDGDGGSWRITGTDGGSLPLDSTLAGMEVNGLAADGKGQLYLGAFAPAEANMLYALSADGGWDLETPCGDWYSAFPFAGAVEGGLYFEALIVGTIGNDAGTVWSSELRFLPNRGF